MLFRSARLNQANDQAYYHLWTSLMKVKDGDLTELPVLFAYLMTAERYFRSGYTKGKVCRALKKIDFSEEQRVILAEAILINLECAGRELNEVVKLVPKVDSPDFRAAVRRLYEEGNGMVSKRAERLIKDYFDKRGASLRR